MKIVLKKYPKLLVLASDQLKNTSVFQHLKPLWYQQQHHAQSEAEGRSNTMQILSTASELRELVFIKQYCVTEQIFLSYKP